MYIRDRSDDNNAKGVMLDLASSSINELCTIQLGLQRGGFERFKHERVTEGLSGRIAITEIQHSRLRSGTYIEPRQNHP